MTNDRPNGAARRSTIPDWLQRDPAWQEQKARLWAMTRDERIRAMRAGKLSLRLCLHWASRTPHEVPLVDGEWAFVAAHLADVVDRLDDQRHRVLESVVRCPPREARGGAPSPQPVAGNARGLSHRRCSVRGAGAART
jgi:hypothetical protein